MIEVNRLFHRAMLLPLLCASLVSRGESLTCEYFVNDDGGIGHAVSVGECNLAEGSVTFPLDASRLNEGCNLVGVRVCNGGCWSVTHTVAVWKPQVGSTDITAAEYFWDVDPGFDNATSIPVADAGKGWFSLPVPASALTDGAHLLGVRVRTAAGWSATHTNLVHIHANELTDIIAVEYFWGTDPGEGEGTAVDITPAPVIELENLPIAFPAEDCDTYTLSVRAKTSSGWGSTISWIRKNTPASSISLSDSDLELAQGTTHQLQAEVAPENTLFKNLVWSSADPDVVTVDAYGMLTAVGVGEATVTAKTSRYDNVASTCKVRVTDSSASVIAPTAADLMVISMRGALRISGNGSASVRVARLDGVVVASLESTLPATIALPAAVYVVTVNGISHKVVVE